MPRICQFSKRLKPGPGRILTTRRNSFKPLGEYILPVTLRKPRVVFSEYINTETIIPVSRYNVITGAATAVHPAAKKQN